MHRIVDETLDDGVTRHLMVLRKEDCGLVEFVIENSGSGMTATAALTTEPEDLERLIKFLIVAHNRHVDSGLVDALKFTSTLFE